METGGTGKEADRRPLRSRSTAWARALAGALARRRVRPNAISAVGMLAGVLAGAALWATTRAPEAERLLLLLAALLVQARLLANLLDGMVAIEGGLATPTGPLWNEVPDRVADAAVLVGAGYAAGGDPALGWLAAVLAVFTAYVRAEARAAGAPNDFCGPMAKPHRMALVTATAVYLAVVPWEWRPTLGNGNVGTWAIVLAVVCAGCAVTAARRLYHAARALSERSP